ncbi:MAG TPA: hydroxymethylbilane synthase, partial [Candidatus Baltobacteraceae bacterium]|nr:hydroxymethylbilane synthase [Candidatus Baltobacteraceae bacterium]
LIVGGGTVALRKAEALVAAGMTVRVVPPRIDVALRTLLAPESAHVLERAYEPADLRDVDLVIAATNDSAINAAVLDDARAARILACDATDPDRGDFTMQATVRVGDLTFSVDSGRSTPAFAKRLARELRESFGPQYDAAARTLARMRTYVRTVLPPAERAPVMRDLAELPIETLATLNPAQAEHEVETAIERVRAHVTAAPTRSAICATRASALALTQSRTVAARLAERGTASTMLTVSTTGDRVQDRPIAAIGTDNVWIKEIEAALLDGRADYAVHSCKDLPGILTDGMLLAAITKREDPRDAFCSERFADFDALPSGAVIGTSSPRRRAQLRALRPDLRYEDIRGNVDTRLRKLRDGHYDAIVLAMAGLNRLGLRATHTVPFDVDRLVPSVAQGALAVETRADNVELAAALRAACNDDETELCINAERAALRVLHAGCNAPLGIHARLDGRNMRVEAAYVIEASSLVLRERLVAAVETTAQAQELGAALARALAASIEGARSRVVVLPRTQDRPSRIAAELRSRGVEVIELREGDDDPARVPDMLIFPSSGSVETARTYLRSLRDAPRRPKVAAMGPQSGAAAREAGFTPDLTSPDASIDAFVTLIAEGLGNL